MATELEAVVVLAVLVETRTTVEEPGLVLPQNLPKIRDVGAQWSRTMVRH